MTNPSYRVLLYYQYVKIENPEEYAMEHLDFCKGLELKGRILVSEEGINGTVSGSPDQTQAYIDAMKADPRFASMSFKIDDAPEHAFKKMHVRHKPELVNLNLEDDINPLKKTGYYLSPKEFFEQIKQPDTVVIDARNDYEYELGHFEGAVKPEINSFRELPDWIKKNKEQFKDKKIVTYCTGGVRCEKFSGWLLEEGFEDVSQLHGGIVTYGKDPEVKGQLWNGKCYVFDERISVPINQVEHNIVGQDHYTNEPCERYVNCGNPDCNKQILCSEKNEHLYMRGCTHECRVHPRNRYIKEHELTEQEVNERLKKIKGDNKVSQR